MTQVNSKWEPGKVVLGSYEVKDKLGEGGFGAVYRVRHKAWNIDLAVKRALNLSASNKQTFIDEAQKWIDLGLHPHIISCYYVQTIDGFPHTFAELAEGGSLHDWIIGKNYDLYEGDSGQVLERILDIAIQFAWGLAYAHEQGLVHQDVKPLNALMTPEGILKVTDFGLAKAGKKYSTGHALVAMSGAYTPAYCSPEQANHQKLSQKTDMWSWALSVLAMFNGGVTWAGGQVAANALQSYLKRGGVAGIPTMPEGLATILSRCFIEAPQQRPVDMPTIAAQLIEIIQQKTGKVYHREMPRAVDLRADSLNNKALSMLAMGKQAEGERTLKEALEIDLIHPEATYNQALLQWQRGEIDDLEIVSRLDKVLGALPDRWPTAYLLSLVHMQRGDFTASLDVLEGMETYPGVQTIISQAKNSIQSSGLIRTLEGHQSWVNCVAFSSDGRKALSSSDDQSLRLWDIETGECLKCLRTYFRKNRKIIKVVFSPDGSHAISGDNYGGFGWWALKSGQYSQSYEGYTRKIQSVDFSRDGHIALVCFLDGSVHLRDMRTGDRLPFYVRGHISTSLLSGCIRQDGKYVMIGYWDGTFSLWDVNARTCLHTFEGHEERVFTVAFSPDGLQALSGSFDRTVKLWDLKTSKCLCIFKGHTDSVKCVVFSPDGRFALSGGYGIDKTMRLWEVSTGICLRTFTGHDSIVNDVCISPDGKQAMSGADKTPRLWSLDKIGKFTAPYSLTIPFSGGKATKINQDFSNKIDQARIYLQKREYSRALDLAREIRSLPGYERENSAMDIWFELYSHCRLKHFKGGWQVKTLKGHEHVIKSVVFHPDGRHVLSGSRDKTMRLWNTSTGDCEKTFHGHEDGINAVAISQDGHYAVSGSSDSTERLWNLKTGACLQIIEGHDRYVECVAISPCGRYVLSGGFDKTLYLWSTSKGTSIRTLKGHSSTVLAVVFSPDGSKALSGSIDKTLRLWDLRNGECLREFKGSTWNVSSVDFSPDGEFALSCSNLSVMLWDIKTGRCLRTFEGHTDLVNAVAFSSNGRYAISGQGTHFEHGHNIKLWDIDTGKCLQTFEGHKNKVNSIDFSPNNQFIISGSDDMTIRLWALDWELEDKPNYSLRNNSLT